MMGGDDVCEFIMDPSRGWFVRFEMGRMVNGGGGGGGGLKDL
jgi:hypothetical protein